MKKIIFSMGLLLFSVLFLSAQENRRDKVEALRVAYISKHLEFTSQEAERFWPVYNSYTIERRAVKKEQRRTAGKFDESMSENDVKILYDEELKLLKKEYELELSYLKQMEEIVGARKYMQLRRLEEAFRKELIRTIREQRKKGP